MLLQRKNGGNFERRSIGYTVFEHTLTQYVYIWKQFENVIAIRVNIVLLYFKARFTYVYKSNLKTIIH